MSTPLFNVNNISINGKTCNEILTSFDDYKKTESDKQLLTASALIDMNDKSVSEVTSLDDIATSKNFVNCQAMLQIINNTMPYYVFNDCFPYVDERIFTTTDSSHAYTSVVIDCHNINYFLASTNTMSTSIYFNVDTINFSNCSKSLIYISENFVMRNSETVNLMNVNIGQIKTSNKNIKVETITDGVKLSKK